MAYVTIPKDLSKVQSKVLFGLTKRQVICFGAAALIGVPLFFLAKGALGTTTAALCMILVMLPFFLFAMYERNGQPCTSGTGSPWRCSLGTSFRTSLSAQRCGSTKPTTCTPRLCGSTNWNRR